jgi:hypothetical protein
MGRERWFYAKDFRRMGPLPNKRLLVEALLGLPDPRGCLIWTHGLPAWTPAREVPEIDRQLAPFVKADVPAVDPDPASSGISAVARPPADVEAVRSPPRAQPPNLALYFGALGAVLALVLAGWFFLRRQREPAAAPSGAAQAAAADPTSAGRPAGGTGPSGPAGSAPAASGTGGFAGWSDREGDLPTPELRSLRGVGAWSGDRLTVTIYNGSTWRITEILVRTSVLSGDEFKDAENAQWLRPAGQPPIDPGMEAALDKVAPDRRKRIKAGVNPSDTGPFEAEVGPKPDGYRWRIEAARGYPPLP